MRTSNETCPKRFDVADISSSPSNEPQERVPSQPRQSSVSPTQNSANPSQPSSRYTSVAALTPGASNSAISLPRYSRNKRLAPRSEERASKKFVPPTGQPWSNPYITGVSRYVP